jgi:hypothetical protein
MYITALSKEKGLQEPEFVKIYLRSPEIDSQPGGIDSWAPLNVYKYSSDSGLMWSM